MFRKYFCLCLYKKKFNLYKNSSPYIKQCSVWTNKNVHHITTKGLSYTYKILNIYNKKINRIYNNVQCLILKNISPDTEKYQRVFGKKCSKHTAKLKI